MWNGELCIGYWKAGRIECSQELIVASNIDTAPLCDWVVFMSVAAEASRRRSVVILVSADCFSRSDFPTGHITTDWPTQVNTTHYWLMGFRCLHLLWPRMENGSEMEINLPITVVTIHTFVKKYYFQFYSDILTTINILYVHKRNIYQST